MTRGSRAGLIALVVLLAALTAGAVWLWRHEADKQSEQAGPRHAMENATRAARADLPVFANVSATTAAADTARIHTVLTSAFDATYAPVYQQSAASAQQHKATIVETVQDAEPISISGDRSTVKVLVYFTEHATFADGSPATDRSLQYLLTMRDVGSRWLVDGADAAQ